MTTRKRQSVPLIVENHPDNYTGYPFITLIQHHENHLLTIIDNADEKNIRAYVLDYCGPEQVDEELVILVANEWYSNNSELYPLSIEFSRRGLRDQVQSIYRKFNINFVSRLIGPLLTFPMNETYNTKRKRKRNVPVGIEVQENKWDR